jgi:hypothetical protein
MRYDTPFVVKRWAPPIGRLASPRRLTVAYQAYTLTEALEWCAQAQNQALRYEYFRPAALFIEHRGARAAFPRRHE